MTKTEPLNPGAGQLCRGCRSFLAEAWEQGHVAPCRLNRWLETKHVKPTLTRDPSGEECTGFERLEEEAEEAVAEATPEAIDVT